MTTMFAVAPGGALFVSSLVTSLDQPTSLAGR
jgi:hypothetical protein